eukprot:8246199-Lingulodinium_polyedra.AAC.1
MSGSGVRHINPDFDRVSETRRAHPRQSGRSRGVFRGRHSDCRNGNLGGSPNTPGLPWSCRGA